MPRTIVIDHIVVSVTDLARSAKFYSVFLGKAKTGKEDISFRLGTTTLFLTVPYTASAKKFNKHNIGLNHIAFQVSSLSRLKAYKLLLDKAGIAHSGIQIDNYSLKEFIYFNDPDGIRLELYLRKPH